jgi:hypothetical protein
MHIISRLMAALVEWLNAPAVAPGSPPPSVDWADLPTYHPSRD